MPGLRDFVFVPHDGGGIIGVRILAEHPERVAGVAISHSGLPERGRALKIARAG